MTTFLIAGLWALAAAGITWHCTSIAQQITYATLADGRKQERKIPLLFRLLLPLAPNISPVFEKPLFAKARTTIDRNIVAAGFEDLISATEIMALRIVLPLTLGIPWLLLIYSAVSTNPESILGQIAPALYVSGPLLLSVSPASWLSRACKTRQGRIRRSLPFVLDLLTLSVEAGMDFMTALQRNVERATIDPLTEELIRVIREIQLGHTRREALKAMAKRVNLQEIRAVVNALVQADELGVSIGSILRIQSEQIRQRRFENAEKLANEAPVKMLVPLLLFIFPGVFLILLGPILYQAAQQMF
ncbi:MAG: type II secretion system F family protein [Kiritimatiellia bacterium]